LSGIWLIQDVSCREHHNEAYVSAVMVKTFLGVFTYKTAAKIFYFYRLYVG